MLKSLLLFISTILAIQVSNAEDLRQLVNLAGHWKFTVGDNQKWADANYDDTSWDHVKVPTGWESQGYDDYDGYAWYRKTIEFEDWDISLPVYLVFSGIDDVDEVYINGQMVGKTGDFPPASSSFWNKRRKYLIPEKFLFKGSVLTIAVRVFDFGEDGGIRFSQSGIFYDYDLNYMDIPLSGLWKFNPEKSEGWQKEKYNDDTWDEMMVPGHWEDQGYEDLNGNTYYRKAFTITDDFDDEDVYLVLGKVDDYEKVYINGESIGSYKTIKKSFEYHKVSDIWKNMRYYKIPKGVLKVGENILAVNVYDINGPGGIYEGPVGITSELNYMKVRKKYSRNKNVWEAILNSLINYN